jgi:L-aspartate semialdehyde sulfurtransferase ferredoxin
MKKIKVTFYYKTKDIKKPITYHLVKDYDIRINILHADIDQQKEGKLFMDMSGKKENIEKALEFVEKEGIKYKIFTQSVIWNEEECIHCGTCTAVCPSGALVMDKEDWSLRFESDKCLACELCVKECPLQIIKIGF